MYRLLKGLLIVLLVSYSSGEIGTLQNKVPCTSRVNKTLRAEARKFLQYLSAAANNYTHNVKLVDWAYQTNTTHENLQKKEDFQTRGDGINYVTYPWLEFCDREMVRQAGKYGLLISDEVADESEKFNHKLIGVINEMTAAYTNMRVCSYKDKSKCDLAFNPDLIDIFRTSRDPDELKYYWLEYHNKLGLRLKQNYSDYVKLSNEYAQYFNYTDKADMWIKQYEGPPEKQFVKQLKKLFVQLKPIYSQMLAFIRKRLYTHYGPSVMNKTGPIPAHLIGSLSGESFQNIIDIIKPYPEKSFIDVTSQLVKKNYTVKNLAEICDNFYQSLGLPPMPVTFWNNSQFEQPKDRNSTCTSAAWDMYDNKDYRVLICAQPNMEDWYDLCHEMGNLQYAIGYQNNVYCYRSGANMAINQAWADVSSLSLSTTSRLSKLGFIDSADVDNEVEINRLFYTALDKIMFLPYGLILELWRWEYFQGNITDENCNTKWWEMRLEYQGLSPPEPRSDKYLDPADKQHVVLDVQYIDYFLAYIFQFQIQQSLCIKAHKYDPHNPKAQTLDKCDVYGSQDAGYLLKKFFAMGSSKRWQVALGKLTGQRSPDARPIANYFSDLYKWLKRDNELTGEVIGW